jgi:hypothetical protein
VKFANPETIVLGKKNVLMQAYGQGMINVQDVSQWQVV